MKKLWLTYAWGDNKDNDVDYIAQELIKYGIEVKLDRWTIKAGMRLWDQISEFISNKDQCDGWAIVATQNSLGSEPCREELAYALDRALRDRSSAFPVIGIFISSVDKSIIPQSISTRLYVSTKDSDWKERIKASLEARAPTIRTPTIEPYFLKIYPKDSGRINWTIEVAPRAGSWSPFLFAIPKKYAGDFSNMVHGPRNNMSVCGGVLFNFLEGTFNDGEWVFWSAQNEANPSASYFISVSQLPDEIVFGVFNGHPQYNVQLKNIKLV